MSGPVSPQVVHEAACWFVQLQSTDASPADHDACQRWRASHAEHEAAWQQALQVSQRFGSLPSALGMQTLARSRRQSRRGVLKSVLVLGAALPAGWMMAREQAWFADYRTAVGERRRLQLQDGTRIELNSGRDIDVRKPGFFAFRQKRLLANLRKGGCEYFNTVLGPGYDRDHADHFHFDVKARKNGYVACR